MSEIMATAFADPQEKSSSRLIDDVKVDVQQPQKDIDSTSSDISPSPPSVIEVTPTPAAAREERKEDKVEEMVAAVVADIELVPLISPVASPAPMASRAKFKTKIDNDIVVIEETGLRSVEDPSESLIDNDSSITILEDESPAVDVPSIEITTETPPPEEHPSMTNLSSLGDDIEIINEGGSMDLDLSQSGEFIEVKDTKDSEGSTGSPSDFDTELEVASVEEAAPTKAEEKGEEPTRAVVTESAEEKTDAKEEAEGKTASEERETVVEKAREDVASKGEDVPVESSSPRNITEPSIME